MKAVILAGFAMGFAATSAWAAEMPAVESIGVGAPTLLTPAPTSAGAAFFSPASPSRRIRRASPTRYPPTAYNPYHPHWIVQVVGR